MSNNATWLQKDLFAVYGSKTTEFFNNTEKIREIKRQNRGSSSNLYFESPYRMLCVIPGDFIKSFKLSWLLGCFGSERSCRRLSVSGTSWLKVENTLSQFVLHISHQSSDIFHKKKKFLLY